jgi:hyperosmotically inducible periplasmic protein
MKTRIVRLTTILAMLALASACSSTRTQQSAGELINDSTLTSKVKVALIDDPITKAGQINVKTFRGVVPLGGFVDSTAAKARAGQLANSVDRVAPVRNDLEISQR